MAKITPTYFERVCHHKVGILRSIKGHIVTVHRCARRIQPGALYCWQHKRLYP